MNLETVTTEIRSLLSGFVTNIKGSTALGLTDLNRFSEGFSLELLREVYDLPGLHNLNKERRNFPGLDLGDDSTRRAFQITATPTLEKVKDTLKAVVDAKLYERFPHIQIFVITEKQSSYSQTSVDQATQDLFAFDVSKDILDYRDLLSACSYLELEQLKRIRDVLKKHLCISTNEFKAAEKPRPYFPVGQESVELNLVPIWIPQRLYLSDYIKPAHTELSDGRRRRRRHENQRRLVAADIMRRGLHVPEDFEVFNGQVVTFQDLSEHGSILAPYYDAGNVVDLGPNEFYGIDEDHLRVFKSLLRRCLQRQLRREHIRWQETLHLFFFGPVRDEVERKVAWKGERTAERSVYKRTMKTNKPEEILSCKHLAFEVAFHLIDGNWYLSLVPTWFFSRDGYRPDGFGAARISWLKRQENDQQVSNHFRFILHRLRELQEDSLFDQPKHHAYIQVGDPVTFTNHPLLPDHVWNPPNQGTRSGNDVGEQPKLL